MHTNVVYSICPKNVCRIKYKVYYCTYETYSITNDCIVYDILILSEYIVYTVYTVHIL